MMHPFEEYLKARNLEALDVSIRAQIRYTTVWNATKGKPITYEHAVKLRASLEQMTGVAYIGPLEIIPPVTIDQQPTLPFKKLTGMQSTE
jgi:hypothetical protein